MAKKDMKELFLSQMTGNTSPAEKEIVRDEAPAEVKKDAAVAVPGISFKNEVVGKKKLVPVYLTDDEYEKLKDFAFENGFARKARGEDKLVGNLSQLLQHLASQL